MAYRWSLILGSLHRFGLVAALLVAGPAAAEEPDALSVVPRDGETVTLIVENDLFGGTDRDYTNGLLLTRLSAANQVPAWYAALMQRAGVINSDDELRFGMGLGHSIFTPEDTGAINPPLDQRPYAGWLYLSTLLIAANDESLRSVQIDFGVVGPSAQGEFVQDNWHRLINANRPRGWDYQLRDEPGLLVVLEHRWREVVHRRMGGADVELQGGMKAAFGNVADYAALDAMIRVGPDIPSDYGPPRIRPSLAGAAYFCPSPGFNWYLFGGAELRAVAHNIFLDGNTWADSRSVERLPLTGDLQLGVVLQYGQFQLALTAVQRFEEYEGQDDPARFGAIVLSRQF